MFIGHFAPAFIAAAHPKGPSLGTAFVAAQLVDLGFFALVLGGVEKMRVTPGITVMNPMDLYHMPYTHSLVGTSGWAAGLALLVWLVSRNRTAALLAGAVVVSHWLLDWLVHTQDMTLAGGQKLGLGLWNYPAIEMPLELLLTFGAMGYFLWRTRPKQRSAIWAALALGGFLLLAQAINWFGPQPTAFEPALAITALISYAVFIALASWVARTRIGKAA